MSEIVFFLEEESAKALLERLFPLLIPKGSQVSPRFIVFEGKQDLEKQLPKKLRGYLNPRARFIVMRDQRPGRLPDNQEVPHRSLPRLPSSKNYRAYCLP
jgi:hypothetical protein